MKTKEPIEISTVQNEETTTLSKPNDSQITEDSRDNRLSTTEITTENSEETFRENTQAMEELFQRANNFKPSEKSSVKPKSRRRGVWKLIKHKPLDQIEGAESQNYYSVVNMFDEIKKAAIAKGSQKDFEGINNGRFGTLNPQLKQNYDTFEYGSEKVSTTEITKTSSTKNSLNNDETMTTEQSNIENFNQTTMAAEASVDIQKKSKNKRPDNIFDSIYSMFGFSNDNMRTAGDSLRNTTFEVKDETAIPTTTVANPTFPAEMTENSFSNVRNVSEPLTEITDQASASEIPAEEPKKTFEVKPWEMKQVRTSTSTEVSHETEICYKGKCIKSKKEKIKA